MAASTKADYLKRYMSKDELSKEDRKKKKKKVKSSKDSRLKIIDDDLEFKRRKPGEATVEDDNEEAPTVAEVIDERPKHIQQLEEYRKNSRWKVLGDDDDGTSALDYGVISHSGVQRSERVKVPSRRRHDTSESDASPPRSRPKTVKHNSNENTDRQLHRHDSDSDASDRRKDRQLDMNGNKDSSPDNSPPRKRSEKPPASSGSDSDASPPRKPQSNLQNKNSSPSQKFFRTQKGSLAVSDLDNSPPRMSVRRHDSESDSSPPRKSRRAASDSDQSPPRKLATGSDVDLSPPRIEKTRKRHDSSDSDQSPPRKKTNRPNSSKTGSDSQDRRKTSSFNNDCEDQKPKKATKTLGGAKAGLSSAKEMREEAKKLREKEDRSFQSIGDDKLGRNAKTVVRDKETGKRRDLKAEEVMNEEEEKKKKEQMEKYQKWGKGLKQQALKDSRLDDQVHEASKPFARLKDDKDLDEMLRKEERLEDPMLNFIRKKKEKEETKSGKKKQKELPKYKGPPPPPNRYNILPGYRWDGVDRSNGFEKKIFASQANKKAVQEMAYKWSTEDM